MTVKPPKGVVCYELSVSDIDDPVGAHIQKAPAGSNGGQVLALAAPTDGFSSGCITNVDSVLAKDILKHPSEYYVNVRAVQYPAGAIRGQLSK